MEKKFRSEIRNDAKNCTRTFEKRKLIVNVTVREQFRSPCPDTFLKSKASRNPKRQHVISNDVIT